MEAKSPARRAWRLVDDDTVQFACLQKESKPYFRKDIIFFGLLYISLLTIFFSGNWQGALKELTPAPEPEEGTNSTAASEHYVRQPINWDSSLIALLCIPAAVLLHGLAMLSTSWSVNIKAFLWYNRVSVKNLEKADSIRVIPVTHNGQPDVCKLQKAADGTLWFSFQKIKYTWRNPKTPGATGCFRPIDFPDSHTVDFYRNARGLSAKEVTGAKETYGLNMFDIPMPTFGELFKEHASAPFFVFQVFCVGLWCLDEYWYYSLVTLFLLIVFEATLVKRRLKYFGDLRSMRGRPFPVHVYRDGKWVEISSREILPGDLISVVRSKNENMVSPCDILLLAGNCVVNEALLTGESVPQLKESIEALPADQLLQTMGDHKRNIVFGGTKVILHEAPPKDALPIKAPPDQGCIGYVLRTGFSTSQGKLIRTILFSTARVTVNNTEALYFIGVLLIFALAAAYHVFTAGLEDPRRSRYKLILNCIMIITSVVPPELPMELSLAVNNSLIKLVKQHIFCTEPFRIPLAGAVDICCFDKTGTLTSDDFIVKGVSGVPPEGSDDPGPVTHLADPAELPDRVKFVIAGCHSLAFLSDAGLVGDPQEKAAFKAIGWNFGKGELATSGKGAKAQVRILHRFRFSSLLKRMTCIVALEHEDPPQFWIVSKGAPEEMAPLMSQLPEDYHARHQHFSRQGCRVLALGYRVLGTERNKAERNNFRHWEREQAEKDLTFAGFLVLQCPIKPESFPIIAQLQNSSHEVMMITGDHVLTACHVAAELGITGHQLDTLVLKARINEEGGSKKLDAVWESVDGKFTAPFNPDRKALAKLAEQRDLCLSGPVMEILLRGGLTPAQLGQLCRYVKVFARTSPDQKEFILAWLKTLGLTTLMCGDGTNDVGALKQAHVGVALLGHPIPDEKKQALPGQVPPQVPGFGRLPPHVQAQQQQQRQQLRPGMPPARPGSMQAVLQARLEQKMAELKAEEEAEGPVRLGDASISAPFTSKKANITSTVDIIRQGRCTLVTTLQMYQILALNCLMTAYSMSVLYLAGVKMGDVQMTLSGMAIAAFFFFISRSEPVEQLSAERPHSRIFTPYMFFSIFGQFAIHLWALMSAAHIAQPYTTDEDRNIDGKFTPNVINSVVFLVSTCATVATFVANYMGRPFMVGLRENTALWRGSIGLFSILLLSAAGIIDVDDALQLSPLPSQEFRAEVVKIMLVDLFGTFVWARVIRWIFAKRPKKHSTRRELKKKTQ